MSVEIHDTTMPTTFRVLLMQLPVPNNPSLNTPLAAGYLKAYAASQGITDFVEINILSRQISDTGGDALIIRSIIEQNPDILAISLYTWNSERSLQIAERVKQHLPHLRVIVGGPEVQRDNDWVLWHPVVDICVLGEGEQTFCELLQQLANLPRASLQIPLLSVEGTSSNPLAQIHGIAFREAGELVFTPDRVALSDLAVIPSPYLAGYLEVPQDGMLMVEVSRWCPYSCSFCLYGRNMGAKLGNRYFGLERVLDEIRWGRDHGIKRIHFVEANLNLVPLFWPLMEALAEINHDHALTFYAELRGEHLTDEVVEALDRANVRFVEVGLQTANPVALKASLRRTNLEKWAAGTRRLYARNIEVFLDVIVGLPADNQAGMHYTLEFLEREELGPYDIFTLQVLPGTAVRQQAEQYQMRFQDRPPYYILGNDQLDYRQLRQLRRELKIGAQLEPDTVEGMPLPRPNALQAAPASPLINWIDLRNGDSNIAIPSDQLANHVDLLCSTEQLPAVTPWLSQALAANPSAIIDLYLDAATHEPKPAALREWRAQLPFQPSYLDRVAIYLETEPAQPYVQIRPRIFLILPWTSSVDPEDYADIANIIWHFTLQADDELPLSAWYNAGGIGIALHFAPDCSETYRQHVQQQVSAWSQETGRQIWQA
jgi:radical SAM superfamily enzyme YgiQ (UPF0313 family)